MRLFSTWISLYCRKSDASSNSLVEEILQDDGNKSGEQSLVEDHDDANEVVEIINDVAQTIAQSDHHEKGTKWMIYWRENVDESETIIEWLSIGFQVNQFF